uniref:Cleft lip and palate associated transmembrane protein n=1 Tax=Timema monikensis TaxID=170555 RepID=A0A7R9E356_9NEOP|nr:unnamed protein product [Timema monikensis]
MADEKQSDSQLLEEEEMDNSETNGDIVSTRQENNEGELDFAARVDAEREKYQPTKLESFFAVTKSLIIRALVIYFITSFFRRPSTTDAPVTSADGSSPAKIPAFNLFENGTVMDLYVYISERKDFSEFNNPDALVWRQDGLTYGDWTSGPMGDGSRTMSTNINTSESLRNNGSLFVHVYVTRHGRSPNPETGKGVYAGQHMAYSWRMLNKFKKLRYTKTHNLLTGETAATPEEVKKAETMKEEIVSHWHPNLTINLVTDQTNWVQGSVPPPLDEYIYFLPGGDKYKPVVYFNEFWNMLKDYRPINKTTENLSLTLTFQPLSLFKWQIYSAQAMRNKWTANMLGDTFADDEDEDQDSLKEALLETSPYLLGLTIAISVLHSIFELLAFKNDIQFWNNRKSLEGLSVRSVFFNVFQSLIVLLYVESWNLMELRCVYPRGDCPGLDRTRDFLYEVPQVENLEVIAEARRLTSEALTPLRQESSTHRTTSQLVFLPSPFPLREASQDVMDVKINRESRMLGIFPRLTFSDKSSYVHSSTKQYDTLAFKYLSWALYPLLGGYAVYSLLYHEHRGWYSFVLNMLYGFLLTFGFIMMTPQLFINYKLKSVAHLPWRMMSYKFLNTFIDDIFAFVIKMPTLYRLGCFRDDIVFFIFLYQRWIYKTDPSRVNEFGFSAEMEQEASQAKKQANGQPLAIEDKAPAAKKED